MSDIMSTAAVVVEGLGLTVGEDGWCRWSVAVERDWRGTALFWRVVRFGCDAMGTLELCYVKCAGAHVGDTVFQIILSPTPPTVHQIPSAVELRRLDCGEIF